MEQVRKDLRIEGSQIYLRPITVEDTDLVLSWRNDKKVVENFIYRKEITREEHLSWLENKVNKGLVIQFIICDKQTDKPLGSIYLQNFNESSRQAEEGIFLGEEEAYGRGIGTEVAKLVLDYAFKNLKLHKLTARVLSFNQGSRKMHEKAGYKQESYLKDELFLDGKYEDIIFYGAINPAETNHERSTSAEKKATGVKQDDTKKVSFIIPCYRSEETIEGVVCEIRDTMLTLPQYTYDIFLVNDCSPDNTFSVIQKLCHQYDNITGISLAKNFGQHSALMAGLRKSDGDIVVCLDDDGQTPADEVGKLLVGIEEGSDVVYAQYETKKHSAFRNFGTWMNDVMTRVMLGKPKDLHLTSYFAAKRFVVESMLAYEKSYPYIIGLVLRATKNISNVPVNHRSREVGASGYTMKKLLSLWFNGFTAFSILPLRMATVAGSVCAGLGFLYGLYTIIKKLVNPEVPMGFSALMTVVVFIGGMLMLMLGLVGEYIGRIYISINNSPQYVIREEIGHTVEDEK